MKERPNIKLPKDYIVTPSNNYSYNNFADWWPNKWKGGAWICSRGHQIPQEKFDYVFYGGNLYACFCPGCNGWVDRDTLKWNSTIKQCTMGHVRRRQNLEDQEDAGDINTIQGCNKVPARGETRERRGSGYTPGKSMDSRKAGRRKPNRSLGSKN